MENQDTIVSSGSTNPAIRSVSVNQGVEWLVGGFRLFAKAPGPWLLAALALLIGSWILGKFWLLGGALSTAFGIVFTGAMMRACQSLENGQQFTAGLQQAATSAPLLILGAIGAGLSFALGLVLAVFGLGAVGMGMALSSPGAVGGMIGIGILAMLVMGIVLGAALWLAPALVVLKGVNPIDALRLSLTATLRNISPYLIFALLALLACIIGALPLGLGLLVVFPVLICASYLAYKAIFTASEAVGYTAE